MNTEIKYAAKQAIAEEEAPEDGSEVEGVCREGRRGLRAGVVLP